MLENNWFYVITKQLVISINAPFSRLLPPPNSISKCYPQCQKWKEAPLNLQWLATLALPHLPLLVPCLFPAPLPSLAIPTQEVKNTSGLPCIRDQ